MSAAPVVTGEAVSPRRRLPALPRVLLVLLLCCFVGRAALAVTIATVRPHAAREGDTVTYLRPARALVEHHRFDLGPGTHDPEYIRTPGYPGFLALMFSVSGESTNAVLLAQAALSTLAALALYLLAARMWSPTVGLLAAALMVLEPLQTYTTGTLVTESLDALLLVLVCAAGYAVFRPAQPRLRSLALLGLVIAAATLVRPVTYYLPVLIVVLLVVRRFRSAIPWTRFAAMTAAFLVPLVVVVGSWQVRNDERAGSWRLSGVEGKNLSYFRAAAVVADQDGISMAAARAKLLRSVPTLDLARPGPHYDGMYRQGVDTLLAHPATTLRMTVEGLVNELTSVRYKAFEYVGLPPPTGLVDAAARAGLLAVEGLAVYGFAVAIADRRHRLAHVAVAGVALYVLLASAGPEAFGARGERFRAPVMPIILLYAAFGAVELVRQHRTRRLAAAA